MTDANELELIGAIIGDGHIHYKPPKYYFGLTGNKKTDFNYFLHLGRLIGSSWGKKVRIFESGRGLRIRVYSKEIVLKLITYFSLPFNKNKCYRVIIPKMYINDFENCKHIIKGIADTDGSVFVSFKKGSPKYPSLEITTVSKNLAEQLREILLIEGFRVANLRSYKSKKSRGLAYKMCLYGKSNLKMWLGKIGFSNPHKHGKAIEAI
jgi:hypothetical protein